MFDPTSIIGQWAGCFEYGPEYGEDLYGEKVQFRLYIDTFIDGQFFGYCVDLEGAGADFEKSKVRGFVDDQFISFTKEYSHLHEFDEDGKSISDVDKPHPMVNYEGEYQRSSNSYKGKWEMQRDIEPDGEGWWVEVIVGKWEMIKDDHE